MDALQVDLQRVERSIRMIRHDKVILDEDLAILYGVETKKLIQSVKRNLGRFPADFMFQLLEEMEQKYDSQFRKVFDAIRQLMQPEPGSKEPIGFKIKEEDGLYPNESS